MPEGFWTAALSAFGGAVGLEIVRRMFTAADVRFDDAKAIRAEQRERIHELEAEIRRQSEAYDALQERFAIVTSEFAAMKARHEDRT